MAMDPNFLLTMMLIPEQNGDFSRRRQDFYFLGRQGRENRRDSKPILTHNFA
jgi:hypothetical protein